MARIKKLTVAQEKARTEYFARRRTRVGKAAATGACDDDDGVDIEVS